MNDLQKMLNDLNIEDMIWITYIFISVFAVISNQYERDYDVTHNLSSYQTFRMINVDVLIVGFIIYLYFLSRSYKRYQKEKGRTTYKNNTLNKVNVMANVLFVIAVLLTLSVSIFSSNPEDINLVN